MDKKKEVPSGDEDFDFLNQLDHNLVPDVIHPLHHDHYLEKKK
jgi:hypothetical protein